MVESKRRDHFQHSVLLNNIAKNLTLDYAQYNAVWTKMGCLEINNDKCICKNWDMLVFAKILSKMLTAKSFVKCVLFSDKTKIYLFGFNSEKNSYCEV